MPRCFECSSLSGEAVNWRGGKRQLKIKELFEKKRFVFSFEIFPPKPTTPLERIYNTLDELKGLKPDFISVTYGAGGSTRDRTPQIAIDVKNNYGIESLAHLTCIEATREETCDLINFLIGNGVHNILALRGDLPQGQSAPKGISGMPWTWSVF